MPFRLISGIQGLLLLFLLGYICLKFDPSGEPFQRLSTILAPLVTGAILWASFHMLVSFLLSPILYRKLSLLYKDANSPLSRDANAQHCEFLNRIVSLVHAISSFSFALVVLSNGFEIGHRNTGLQSKLLMFSASYFVFDYSYVTYHRLGDGLDSVHHFISVGGLLSTLLLDQCGGEVVCAIVVTEVSNPFLHIRKMLQILKLHKQHFSLFRFNNYMFALSYLLGRMVFGGWFVYLTIESPNSPLFMKVRQPHAATCICACSCIVRCFIFCCRLHPFQCFFCRSFGSSALWTLPAPRPIARSPSCDTATAACRRHRAFLCNCLLTFVDTHFIK